MKVQVAVPMLLVLAASNPRSHEYVTVSPMEKYRLENVIFPLVGGSGIEHVAEKRDEVCTLVAPSLFAPQREKASYLLARFLFVH